MARPLIADIIRSIGYPKQCDLAFAQKVILASYPWGPAKMWPYRVWVDEMHRQLRDRPRRREDARQLVLFEEGP
jgi:hypothetical protein